MDLDPMAALGNSVTPQQVNGHVMLERKCAIGPTASLTTGASPTADHAMCLSAEATQQAISVRGVWMVSMATQCWIQGITAVPVRVQVNRTVVIPKDIPAI
ncbi:hypothetical protein SRHO_G00151100 [Serrasalmus rhombeus]